MSHWNQEKPWEDRYGDTPGQSTGWEMDEDVHDKPKFYHQHPVLRREYEQARDSYREYLRRLAKATEECQEDEE